MSSAEDPTLLERARGNGVSVEDVRELCGAGTPHFALQLRERIEALIAGLPADEPARLEGEREMARLKLLADSGQEGEAHAGAGHEELERPLPSLAAEHSAT